MHHLMWQPSSQLAAARRTLIRTTVFASLFFLTLGVTSLTGAERPNVIVIMADDLGYETIGANGGESYATPRLDALAGTGLAAVAS